MDLLFVGQTYKSTEIRSETDNFQILLSKIIFKVSTKSYVCIESIKQEHIFWFRTHIAFSINKATW